MSATPVPAPAPTVRTGCPRYAAFAAVLVLVALLVAAAFMVFG